MSDLDDAMDTLFPKPDLEEDLNRLQHIVELPSISRVSKEVDEAILRVVAACRDMRDEITNLMLLCPECGPSISGVCGACGERFER